MSVWLVVGVMQGVEGEWRRELCPCGPEERVDWQHGISQPRPLARDAALIGHAIPEADPTTGAAAEAAVHSQPTEIHEESTTKRAVTHENLLYLLR